MQLSSYKSYSLPLYVGDHEDVVVLGHCISCLTGKCAGGGGGGGTELLRGM